VPKNVTDNSTYAAGELILPPVSPTSTRKPHPWSRKPGFNSNFTTPYLYASNRNTATNPPPEGDSIAIFSLDPLKLVDQVYTGLNQLRGMALFGEDNQYIVVGGLVGDGGVVVYERTDGGRSLVERARTNDTDALGRSTFVWVNQ
jgi:hypothetical protein